MASSIDRRIAQIERRIGEALMGASCGFGLVSMVVIWDGKHLAAIYFALLAILFTRWANRFDGGGRA